MTAPDTQTPKPLRADARRNRERIIEAARTVFAERGSRRRWTTWPARPASASGTVYRHFPNKEALLGELVAAKFRAFGDNAERALEVEDPWEAFAGLLRANGEICVRDIGIQEALARTPELGGWPSPSTSASTRSPTSSSRGRRRRACCGATSRWPRSRC